MGVLALILLVGMAAIVTAYFLTSGRGSELAIPVVVITAPVNGSQVQANVPVTMQATASDPSGVTQMELWVSGVKTAESISPVEQGQPTLTASFQWIPQAPGSYTLEVRAYNRQGETSAPTMVTVNVVGAAPTATRRSCAEPGEGA